MAVLEAAPILAEAPNSESQAEMLDAWPWSREASAQR